MEKVDLDSVAVLCFRVTVANAYIGSLKSFPTSVCVSTHAGEIWTKSYGQKYTEFWVF